MIPSVLCPSRQIVVNGSNVRLKADISITEKVSKAPDLMSDMPCLDDVEIIGNVAVAMS